MLSMFPLSSCDNFILDFVHEILNIYHSYKWNEKTTIQAKEFFNSFQ